MTEFFAIVWIMLAVAATFSCGYLLLLTLLSEKPPPPSALASFMAHHLRFDIIVPAHNERVLIARTVANLLAMNWPRDSFRVIVVADNCSDDTARIAREAGAHVIERRNQRLRGKGYALEFAFRFSQSCGWADAVIVVDADSEASPNLLEACAARIGEGAHAIQAHYDVREPHKSWRTRLICIAFAAFHRVRSRAREWLSVSAGIRGNGWCVTHALLAQVPYRSFSLAEDIEFGIALGLAGFRVHYADEAHVKGDMVSDAASARSQRRRWEHGRFNLIRAKTVTLIKAALRSRSSICFDLACDLLVLPLSYILLGVALLLAIAGGGWWLDPTSTGWTWAFWWGVVCAVCVMLYVLRGWELSGIGARGLVDLARAPAFVVWKLATMLRGTEPLEWVRTKRRTP